MTSIIRILPLLLCSIIVMGAQSSNTKKQNESKNTSFQNASLQEMNKQLELIVAFAKKLALNDQKLVPEIENIQKSIATNEEMLKTNHLAITQLTNACGMNFLKTHESLEGIKGTLQKITEAIKTNSQKHEAIETNSQKNEVILIWSDLKSLDKQDLNFEEVKTLASLPAKLEIAPALTPQDRHIDEQDKNQIQLSNASNKPSDHGKSSSIFSLFSQNLNEKSDTTIYYNDKSYLANELEKDPKKNLAKTTEQIQRAKEATEERSNQHLKDQNLITKKAFTINNAAVLGDMLQTKIIPICNKVSNLIASGFLEYNEPLLMSIYSYAETVKSLVFYHLYLEITESIQHLKSTQKILNTTKNRITKNKKFVCHNDYFNYDNAILVAILSIINNDKINNNDNAGHK